MYTGVPARIVAEHGAELRAAAAEAAGDDAAQAAARSPRHVSDAWHRARHVDDSLQARQPRPHRPVWTRHLKHWRRSVPNIVRVQSYRVCLLFLSAVILSSLSFSVANRSHEIQPSTCARESLIPNGVRSEATANSATSIVTIPDNPIRKY